MTSQTAEACEDLRAACWKERRISTRWIIGIGVVLSLAVMSRIEQKLDRIDSKLETQATMIQAFHTTQ